MNTNFPANSKPIQLYRFEKSGHCHRVELMMSLLELPYDTIELERDGSNQPEDFLQVSPMGQVPVIDDNGFKLADSNAILVYLVKKYSPKSQWLPEHAETAAKVQRWLSTAAGDLVSGPAIARFSKVFNVEIDYETAKKKSIALFEMLDDTLNSKAYIVGEEMTIADVSLYTYVAHAPEGGLELDAYANIMHWLERIQSLDNFIPMKSTQTT